MSEIYKLSWATLYMIFSEQMNQKCLDIMDMILCNLVEKFDEDPHQYWLNYQTAWVLLKTCFISINDENSIEVMEKVFDSVIQDEKDLALIRKEVGNMCELIK